MALCLAAPWGTRGLVLGEKRLAPSLVDLRGVLADGSVALLVLAAAGVFLSTRRWWGSALALLSALSLVLVSFAMYEFISIFDSLYALSHAGFLADATFLGGSVSHLRHPILFAALAGGVIVGAVWARPPGKLWWKSWALALAASALGQWLIPVSHFEDEWRQRHAVQANFAALCASRDTGAQSISAGVGEVFRGDLRGKRWAGPFSNRPNVLLILIEGASGAYLPSVAASQGIASRTQMPRLDVLARDHVLFTRVISEQRQTNRGEYSVLCGDYPKLLTGQSKMSEQVAGAVRRCLPEALREQGYTTTYVQSAPLAFMLKDQFMRKAGYEELIGDAWFERSYARSDWGVDDRAFFEQALTRISELHQGKRPFFATMLTVGTHHPFTIPDRVAAHAGLTRQERAFRWADDALVDFLRQLEQREVLRDTIVIITSDESAGLSHAANAIERLLSQSWSFALVMLPDALAKRIDTPQAHVDIPLTVLDLLGMERQARGFLGRSWFRGYRRNRLFFAGNTYARRVMMWEPSGSAVVCNESFTDCIRSVPEGQRVFGPTRKSEPVPAPEQQLLKEVSRLTRSGRRGLAEGGSLLLLADKELRIRAVEGKKILAGGQYLDVPAGTTLRVDLDLEVIGGGAAVDFHHDVFLNGYAQLERKGFRVRGGQRWRLSYEIGVPRDSGQLVVQLYATIVSGKAATIRFHDARLAMIPGSEVSPTPVIVMDELEPARAR